MDERSVIEREAHIVLGAEPTRLERLTHSQATRGVWRVAAGSQSTPIRTRAGRVR